MDDLAQRMYGKDYISRFIHWTLALYFIASVISYTTIASAAQVTVAWDANTEPGLAGYKIYYKTGSSGPSYDGLGAAEGNSPIIIQLDPNGDGDTSDGDLSDPASPEYTLHGLSDTETTYSVVTAYDADGNESGYSNELFYQPPSPLTLSSLSITGPNSVNENSTASYTATATFSDGTTQTVTGSAGWSESSTYASVEAGVLTATEVQADQAVTITASYSYGGVAKGAIKQVTITDVPLTLSNLAVTGPASVNENSTASYTATATFSDGTTQTVTESAGWSEGSTYASIEAGVLNTTEVQADQAVTITASYSYGGVAKGAIKQITITDVPLTLSSLAIAGPNSVSENSTASYTATATFSDGTTQTVTESAGWSEGSTYASVEAGVLNTTEVQADQAVTITASYSYGGVSTEATQDVQILDVPVLNQPPEADAGPDQRVDEGDTVTLNGSNSTDPDDGIDSFLWIQTGGTPVALSSPSSPQPTFTAPDVEPDGMALTFQLTVTDKGDLESTDDCIVNVSWVNQPPKADAGSDQKVDEGSVVLLDGSSSSDVDDGIVSYNWTQKSGLPVDLDNPAAMQPRFAAPDVGPQGGSLSFLLTVSDAGGLQATDNCVVNVSWVNEPPSANAGPDNSSSEQEVVMLDGSGSEDPDDGIASYRWHQKTGTPVTLDDPTAVQPSFRAPGVKPGGESLAFQLTVSDTGGLQSTDDCVVDVAEVQTRTVEINELETGTYVTSGRGKNKSTAFVLRDAFAAGESVVIRAYVVDATAGRPLANGAVEITVTGPGTAILLTGLSDANGMVEATWNTSPPRNRVKSGTPSGTYTATVNNVAADGYTWEGASTTSTTFTIR